MSDPSTRKRKMTVFLWLLTGAAVFYVALALGMFLIQRQLLYHTAGSLPPPPAPFRAVTVPTADGLSLTAWYAPPPQPGGKVVLSFHGNSGTIAHRIDRARRALDSGMGVMLQEYRGFAGMPGEPTEQGLYEDGRAALRWLAAQGIDERRVVLYGESLGTGVAVQLASETKPAGLMLDAAYTSIPDVAARQYFFLPVHLLALDRFESLAKIGRVAAPVLLMHGQYDLLIPPKHARRLFSAAQEPKKLVMLPAGHPDVFIRGGSEAVAAFLAELSRVAAAEP
jgi:fermentation-respiration switch protein FrsA (DUF1100 family)